MIWYLDLFIAGSDEVCAGLAAQFSRFKTHNAASNGTSVCFCRCIECLSFKLYQGCFLYLLAYILGIFRNRGIKFSLKCKGVGNGWLFLHLIQSPVFIRSRTIQFSLGKYCSRHHILINTHMYIAYQYTTRNPTANPHITSLLSQKSVLLRLSTINTALTTTALSPPPFSPTSASFYTTSPLPF